MKDGIVVDVDTWPVVRFTYNGFMRDEDWLEIYSQFDQLYARRESFAILNDSTHLASVPGANVRRSMAELTRAHEEKSRRYVIHSSIVVPNAVARGALTALNWLSPPVYEQSYHAARLEGLDAAVAALKARGKEIGPKLLAYRVRLLAMKD